MQNFALLLDVIVYQYFNMFKKNKERSRILIFLAWFGLNSKIHDCDKILVRLTATCMSWPHITIVQRGRRTHLQLQRKEVPPYSEKSITLKNYMIHVLKIGRTLRHYMLPCQTANQHFLHFSKEGGGCGGGNGGGNGGGERSRYTMYSYYISYTVLAILYRCNAGHL